MLTSGVETRGTSQADILQRIKQVRGTAEPAEAEPTKAVEAVDVSEEEAPETEEEAAIGEPEVSEESEEAAEATEEEAEIDDQEELYVEIDGREVALSEIKEGLDGGMRQADYTRKTQELAEQRKEFEALSKEFNSSIAGKQSEINELAATLKVIIEEESLSADDLQELREYDPEEFIKYQEKMSARKDALSKAKKVEPVSDVDVVAERQKLWDAHPAWGVPGKQTQAFNDDMALLQEYAQERGFDDSKINSIITADDWETHLDAARYRKLSKKNASIEKRVRKAPVITKPKMASQTSLQEQIKKAEATLKKTGRTEDAIALRKLKRKLNS